MSVVVVATNGSEACRRAVDRTAALFDGPTMFVATVVPGAGPDGIAGGRSDRADPTRERGVRGIADVLAVDAARALLADACRALGGGAQPILLSGDPVDALVVAVRTVRASALVVGSLGRTLTGVLGTSVGAALVRTAPCPVVELG